VLELHESGMIIKLAEVRNIEDDPSQSGRVKIRLYNEQHDETTIPDEDLPWALPMQPITSAAFNGVGTSPHGLLVGSRVIVTYMPEDKAQQYPIILGSFSRAFAPIVEGIQRQDTETGNPAPAEEDLDPDGPLPPTIRNGGAS